ncbi:MAG: hypothetical protein ACLTYN_15250 [Dysosmobacter welbionis]
MDEGEDASVCRAFLTPFSADILREAVLPRMQSCARPSVREMMS